MRLFKQLLGVFAVLGVAFAVLSLFTFDVIKIDWVTFMEIQPAYKPMENPLAVPARSIPVEGPLSIPNMGAPENPVAADEVSIARGRELFMINCQMCHGEGGQGNGPIAANIVNKPANLTLDVTQSKSDGSLFLTISNGVLGRMPPMNENLTVRDRWDLVNFIRTLVAPK
ncbi:MAG: cytochrome c [Chloroflexi bacterium]|nr:cytochrome c [Chloroflexota bacterium]